MKGSITNYYCSLKEHVIVLRTKFRCVLSFLCIHLNRKKSSLIEWATEYPLSANYNYTPEQLSSDDISHTIPTRHINILNIPFTVIRVPLNHYIDANVNGR